MHHDLTLDIFDGVTALIGAKLRDFRDNTCTSFATQELPREYNARIRREAKKNGKRHSTNETLLADEVSIPVIEGVAGSPILATSTEDASSALDNGARVPSLINPTTNKRSTRRRKILNINTYKYHSLGDYAATIRRIGTTDSYSTESVSYRALFS